jgi:hypothetical protein
VPPDAGSRGALWRIGAFVLWALSALVVFGFCYRLLLIVFDSLGIDVVVVGEGTRADPKNPPGQTVAVVLGGAITAFVVWVLHQWWRQGDPPREF